jgi:hypothetical protein
MQDLFKLLTTPTSSDSSKESGAENASKRVFVIDPNTHIALKRFSGTGHYEEVLDFHPAESELPMVGVPGHSKACCTCRRRKKGVS